MKKKIEVGTVIFIVIVAVILACLATYMYLTSMMPSLVTKENFYDRITEVNKTIEQRYVGEADSDSAMNALLSGYVSAVDKYSTYLNEEEYSNYALQMNGKYSGAGVTVKYVSSSGLLKIINVKSNSPAASAGIAVGDMIYTINGRNVDEMSYEEAVSLLKAEIGTVINLVVLRGEQSLEKFITVSEYVTSSIDYDLIENDVGYIAISEFDNTTFEDFKKAVEDLEGRGAAQYIFDVRNNTAGVSARSLIFLTICCPRATLLRFVTRLERKRPIHRILAAFLKNMRF